MKTMITLLFSALCVATVSAQTDEKDNAMLNNGINFLDIPYVAHTLEVTDGEEELIINCDEVDCTTFVEYTLAMALSPTEDGQVAEGDFATNLQKIRYRDGKINGYPSRLHYIADWVNNGDIIAITTNTPGLDVAHMGIAFYVNGKLSLLHASSKEKKVVVSKVALGQMLQNNDNWTGIRVLRMKK